MNRSLLGLFAFSSCLLSLVTGCAAGGTAAQSGGTGGTGGGSGTCAPGLQVACPCPGGAMGAQACNAEGNGYTACDCGGTSGSGGGVSAPCGNGTCADDETCHTCPEDCGACEPCTLAPSCDNAQIPPADMVNVPAFDSILLPVSKAQILERLQKRVAEKGAGVRLLAAALAAPTAGEPALVGAVREALAQRPKLAATLARSLGRAGLSALAGVDVSDLQPPVFTTKTDEFPGGTVECGAPQLRIRVAKVTVHEEDDDFANDIVYCALSSEAKAASEIRVTPQTPNLDEGDSFSYPIEAGVFWGQKQPETPAGNLLLTYDCFEADSNTGYQDLIDSIGDAATQIGGVAGSSGWVFTVIGAIAPVISGALGLDGDDHLFNAQQTIPLDQQLDLTNGRFWSVRRHGSHLNGDWDWELRVEAWGCSEFGMKK